jgi:prepilin-type N-terminal cleavage/methylation domain-containing protein
VARSTALINRSIDPLPPPRSRRQRAGYTLAESLIASVVLAIAIVAISGTLAASYQQNNVRGNTTTALNLAQQLMEEIAAKPIDLPTGQTNKPGWQQGQTDRRQYDTLDDYNGYTDFSGTIQAADGSTVNLSNGGTYQRTVSVQSGAVPAGLTGPPADFVMVTVTVKMPHSQSTSVSQLFTRTTRLR